MKSISTFELNLQKQDANKQIHISSTKTDHQSRDATFVKNV